MPSILVPMTTTYTGSAILRQWLIRSGPQKVAHKIMWLKKSSPWHKEMSGLCQNTSKSCSARSRHHCECSLQHSAANILYFFLPSGSCDWLPPCSQINRMLLIEKTSVALPLLFLHFNIPLSLCSSSSSTYSHPNISCSLKTLNPLSTTEQSPLEEGVKKKRIQSWGSSYLRLFSGTLWSRQVRKHKYNEWPANSQCVYTKRKQCENPIRNIHERNPRIS